MLLILRKKLNFLTSFLQSKATYSKMRVNFLCKLHYLTDKHSSMAKFVNNDILKIIQNLNPNKAHHYSRISILMLKLSGDSLCSPLELIFKDCLANGIFPSDWKKGNIVPVHKKNYKQCLNNYRPLFLIPIYSKILQWLILNTMLRLIRFQCLQFISWHI